MTITEQQTINHIAFTHPLCAAWGLPVQ